MENFEKARNESKKEHRNFPNTEDVQDTLQRSKLRKNSINIISKKKKEISFSDENMKNLLSE